MKLRKSEPTARIILLPIILLFSLGMVGIVLAAAHHAQNHDLSLGDLSASTLTAPVKVQLDQPITYTLSLLNVSSVSSSAVLTDAIPFGTSYKPGSLRCSDDLCWYDPETNAVRWEGTLAPSSFPSTRYFFTALDGSNTVYVAEFLHDGWFVTDTWGTVATFNVPEITDTLGIDYDAEHGVLYHSDFFSDTIVVTDLNGNFLEQFRCPGSSGFNSGVTYLEGSSPPEIWVTNFESATTTRCATSGSVIEVFPNTWATDAFGLVFNPLEGMVRYAHEGFGVTIWDIDEAIPHTVIFSTSLSAMNPGWPFLWDNRNGIEFDASTGTYFLTDFNGSLDINDNLVEITPAGIILNAWELDGAGNDSYDGSAINKVFDLAIVPAQPLTITFAVLIDVAPSDMITNTAVIASSALSVPITLTVSTEIAEQLYFSWDFEENDGGFTPAPASEWQWGVPSPAYLSGPPSAHSGHRVWGTDLLADANDEVWVYPHTISHTLSLSITLPIDPNALYLQWWDWYGAESDGDNRSLQVNGTEIWNDGGVSQPDWVNHSVDLSNWAGQSVLIEFRLNTCCTNPGPPGWYLDDVAIHTRLQPNLMEVSGVPIEIEVIQNSDRTTYFAIHNAGSLGLIWSAGEMPITETLTGAGDIPWLTIAPINGIIGKNSTQQVGITLDAVGLSTGIYSGTVVITSNDEQTPVFSFLVTMIVKKPIVYLPIVRR